MQSGPPFLLLWATFALLGLFGGTVAAGVVLLLRRRGATRWLGLALLIEAALALAAQVALSTIPFGLGEPMIRVRFRETLLEAAALLLGLAVAAGALLLLIRLARRSSPMRGASIAALLLALPVLAPAALWAMTRASLPARERERDPARRTITLPQGFTATIYAQGMIDNPTSICFGPDKQLYIADIGGTIWRAQERGGKATAIRRWAGGFSLLVGIVWHDGELYAASSGKIEALKDADGDGVAERRRLVVQGLPSMVLQPHSNNGIAFGPDGRLYFGVGSTTEGQVEMNSHAAAVLSVKPDGSDLQVFARGLGNTFDVAFDRNGELFGGDNSPQGEPGEDPPDEFNHIARGGHYGYPYAYGDPPDNGGTTPAIVTFPPHSAPTGTTFYTGTTYPAEYRDAAFVALWARGEVARVETARAPSGNYLGRATTFGRGFLYPIDVVTGPDGNLYVADFGTSAVYRITYDPNKAF